MAQPSTFVNQVRNDVVSFMEAWEKLKSDYTEYVSQGGEAFVDAYLEVDNVPVTDISTAQFVSGMTSVIALQDLLEAQFHQTNLNKLRA